MIDWLIETCKSLQKFAVNAELSTLVVTDAYVV